MHARSRRTVAALAAAALALAACAGGDDPDDPPATEVDPAAEVLAKPPAAGGTEPGVPPEMMAGGVPLTVAESPEHGAYVADSEGRALYVREGDPATLPPCTDYPCMAMWPPLVLADPAPELAGAGIQRDLVGTTERAAGATQVTYGGKPLYYYGKDTGPGQATGHDVTDEWGEWYLVQPSGEMLHHAEEGGGS